MPLQLNVLIEGHLEEAMARRLAAECGFEVARVYGKHGWQFVRDNVAGHNEAAQFVPYLALVDFMDTGFDCPGMVVESWLPDRRQEMVFRVVVRELESWALADREGLAEFLHVSVNRIPRFPEREPDPKRTLVNLARRSKSTRIRKALVPREGSSGVVGPDYTYEMELFIRERWSPAAARVSSPSLDRCLTRLCDLAGAAS